MELLSEEQRQLRARARATQTALEHCEALLRLTNMLLGADNSREEGQQLPNGSSRLSHASHERLQGVQQQLTASVKGLHGGVPSFGVDGPAPLGWEPAAATAAFEGFDLSAKGVRDKFVSYISASATWLW